MSPAPKPKIRGRHLARALWGLVRDFVASACGLSLTLLSAMVTLASFSALLWHLSNAWTIPIAGQPRHIPGLMLWVAIAFSLLSMWVTHVVGRRLVPLNFDKIRFEADFRYGLVRYRDHVEAVTLMQGEPVEKLAANGRFDRVVDNFNELVRAQRNLTVLTNGIGQANGLVPLVVAGLACFGDMLTLGEAFGLDTLAARLDDEEPWEQKLALHEQQRLALARVLLHEPEWVLLDEATSDLDEATEAKAFETLTARLPHAAMIAAGERPGVLRHLPRRWTLTAKADGRVALAAA